MARLPFLAGLTVSLAVFASLSLGGCSRARRAELLATSRAVGGAEAKSLDETPAGAVLRAELDAWRETPALDAADGRAMRLAESEGLLRRALRSEDRGDDASLFVHAFSVFVPALPPRAADRLLDAEAERKALGADEGETREGPGGGLRLIQMALLDMGEAPFKYDFRWTVRLSRRALPNGAIEIRYDLEEDPTPEHVSLFRGIALLEREGKGCRWTEVLAIGSTVSAPFFLKGKAHDEVSKVMTKRMQRLAESMR